jgi:hypothetical protein
MLQYYTQFYYVAHISSENPRYMRHDICVDVMSYQSQSIGVVVTRIVRYNGAGKNPVR